MCRSWDWNIPGWQKNCGATRMHALAPFGDKAGRLRELADLIVQRKA
jgi:hypothetical protein